jgi:2-methylisocitrate lyase-like PEP mutase family enzyme
VESQGFPAVYLTGYGASASMLGRPDLGLMSMSEMVTQAKNMAAAVNVPLIADGDTGYGGMLNVMRTVHEYEMAGVAAIQMEDQTFPKRCGHMEEKRLIPEKEMVAKIKAAVYARKSEDFMIIARTDARAVEGLDQAVHRALAYSDAGADVIFVEAPRSEEEMRHVSKMLKLPLMANMVEKGKTPLFTAGQLESMGYRIVIYPVSTLYTATKAIIGMLCYLKKEGTTYNCPDCMVDFSEFNRLIGVEEMLALEKLFTPSKA